MLEKMYRYGCHGPSLFFHVKFLCAPLHGIIFVRLIVLVIGFFPLEQLFADPSISYN